MIFHFFIPGCAGGLNRSLVQPLDAIRAMREVASRHGRRSFEVRARQARASDLD